MPAIKLTTFINAPLEKCFDLARDIDLHKVSTAGSNEEAIAGVTSGLIGLGEEVTWKATHFGIRQTLTSRITAFSYPTHFRDEMVKGILKAIRHDHYFEENEGITIMTDDFYFESPFGMLGKLADLVLIRKYLENLLVRRNQVIKEAVEGGWRSL